MLLMKYIKNKVDEEDENKILRTVGNDIICYHASPNKFDKPKISKTNLLTQEDILDEGMGIYCLNNKSLMYRYKYFYECYIKGDETDDLSTKTGVNKWFNKFLKHIKKVTGMNNYALFNALNINKETLIKDIIKGKYKISNSHYIRTLFDNSFELYEYSDDFCEWYEKNMIPKAFICKIHGYKGLGIIIKDLSVITYWKMIKGDE